MREKADIFMLMEGNSSGRVMAMCTGHHRGLRPGHAVTGVTWELGRSNCFLMLRYPDDKDYWEIKSPGACC